MVTGVYFRVPVRSMGVSPLSVLLVSTRLCRLHLGVARVRHVRLGVTRLPLVLTRLRRLHLVVTRLRFVKLGFRPPRWAVCVVTPGMSPCRQKRRHCGSVP